MATVTLSEVPETGQELEDYVAALFLASGHFVEKNVTSPNVMELDIVATDYRVSPPRVLLTEAKGGGWGYGDMFKVVGWMNYLRIKEGSFFCQGAGGKDLARVREVFEPLGVTIVDLQDFSDSVGKFGDAGLPTVEHPEEVTHWRWVHQGERLLSEKLIAQAKNGTADGPRAVLEYHRLVNDGIFFQRSILGRLTSLYEAFYSHPRLALSCAREMDGKPFEANIPYGTLSPKLTEALQDGSHVLLQAAFYAEHRAKLAILKAAIDLACGRPKLVAKILKHEPSFALLTAELPESFLSGLRWLTKQPTHRQYARLWQTFLWSWGGFYLKDRKTQEFAWLAAHTGVPVEEIPTALEAFDHFFPGSDWWATPGSTQCRQVKLMPTIFKGIGAHRRLAAYDCSQYGELGYNDYTASDMAGWHNRFVELLTGHSP
jgi:hypothetical protein